MPLDKKTQELLSPEAAAIDTAANLHKEIVADRTKKRTVPLSTIIGSYQQSWYQRLDNIGAGNSSKSKGKETIDRALTLLSGGLLGSYGLSRDATLNKKIDELTKQRAKTELDSTLKATNLFASAAEKLEHLATKVTICEELEQAVDTLITQNKESLELFESMRKKINPNILGKAREGIANGWERAKDSIKRNPGKSAATAGLATAGAYTAAYTVPGALTGLAEGVAIGGFNMAAIQLPSAILSGTTLAATKLWTLGTLAVVNPAIAIPAIGGLVLAGAWGARGKILNRKSLQTNMEMLEKMRDAIQTIKTKSQEGRDAIINKIEQKYAPEKEVEQNMRKLIKLRCPGALPAFELAVTSGNLRDIFRVLDQNKASFHPMEMALMQRYARTLVTRRSRNLRANINALLGETQATGPSNIGNLVKRLVAVDNLTGVRGKRIKFEPENKEFILWDIQTEGSTDYIVLQSPRSTNDKRILQITEGTDATFKVESKEWKVSWQDRLVQINKVQESDLKPDLDATQKGRALALLTNAKRAPLKDEEYTELGGYILTNVPPFLFDTVTGKSITDSAALYKIEEFKQDNSTKISLLSPPVSPRVNLNP